MYPCLFPVGNRFSRYIPACLILAILMALAPASPVRSAEPDWLDTVLARHIRMNNLVYATLFIQTPDQTYLNRIESPELQTLLPDHVLPGIGQARYRWGEIAHIWLSLATLALEDQGKLDSTSTLGRYLYGEPLNSVKNLKKVTLTDLITQDAAIADYTDNSAFFRRVMKNGTANPWTRDALVKLITELPAYDQPGKAVWSSKSHDLLLALAMERQTGQSWQNLARDIILSRAGLENTGFGRHQPNLAPGLQDIDFTEDGVRERLDTRSLGQDIPGQDLAGSVRDLSALLRWLLASDDKTVALLRGLANQHMDGGGTGLVAVPGMEGRAWSVFGHQPGWQVEAIYLPKEGISITLASAGGATPEITPALMEIILSCACIPENPGQFKAEFKKRSKN